jgi:hypothetical protein
VPDNTDIKNAAGGTETIGTDEITGGVADGAKVERIKVGHGADGSYVDVSASDPLPVTPAGHAFSATVDAASSTDLPLMAPLDVSGYASATLRVVPLGGYAADPPVGVSVLAGTTDDPESPSWQGVPLWFTPIQANDASSVDSQIVAGAYDTGEVTFPLTSQYLMMQIYGDPAGITAGSFAVHLVLRPVAKTPAVQHVKIDQALDIASILGVLPTVAAVETGGGDLTEQDDIAGLIATTATALRVEITGTWAGEITLPGRLMNTATGEWVTTTTGNGTFVGPPPTGQAFSQYQTVMTTYTSGTASVVMVGWAGAPPVELVAVQVDGAPVATANPLPVTVISGGGGGGTVDVSNFPSTYPVTDNGGSLTVDGTVAVSNFPAAQPVTDNGGSLTVDGTVSVGNFPAAQPVTDNGGSLTVDGTVAVSNFPAAQPVTDNGGSLTVDDGGGSLTVDGTVTAAGSGMTASGSASSATDIIASTDVSAYRSWSVQITGTWSGICVVQASNDGTNWATVAPDGLAFNMTTNSTGAGITGNGLYTGSIVAKYMRLRCSSYTSGTVSAVWFLTTAGEPAHALAAWDGAMIRPLRMDSTNDINALRTRESAPTGSTIGTVVGSATSVTLLASNTARRGAIVWNESTATLYVALGATASTSSYTWQVAPGGYLELPQPCYTGAIAGIWPVANGAARVTELTT